MGNKRKILEEYENKELIVDSSILSKSNLLITSKFKSTLDCQKVMFIALLKFQEKQYYIDEHGQPVIEMPAAELKNSINSNSHSIYSRLDSIAQQMTSTSFGITVPEQEMFDYISIITRASYIKGTFRVVFNAELMNTIQHMKTGFTKLPRQIMMSWKTVYGYRMYEILRQRAFYPANYTGKHTGLFQADFDLYEFRLLLGVTNSNLDSVQRVLRNTNPPDYKKACEASPEKIYNSWRELQRNVIVPAVKEICENPISDIKIEYIPKKKAHNEVYGITFIIKTREFFENQQKEDEVYPMEIKNNEIKPKLSDSDRFVICMQVCDKLREIGYSINYANVISLCEEANYDISIIDNAINVLKNSNNSSIKNVVGWLISAIRNPFTEPVHGKQKAGNSFNDFPQRTYDFDEIERIAMEDLLKN